jgi:uncharacterized protein
MMLLDTSVLVYAVGDDHALRAPARRLIEAVGSGERSATTTVEVVQEFTHVRARRRSRIDAAALARQVSTLLTPLTPVTSGDLDAGLALFERHDELGAFDAVLVAVTRRIGAQLVTADRVLLSVMTGDSIDLADDPAR